MARKKMDKLSLDMIKCARSSDLTFDCLGL